jgi:hypothetical protein
LDLSFKLLLPLKRQDGMWISGERLNIRVTLFTRGSEQNSWKQFVPLKLSENGGYWEV